MFKHIFAATLSILLTVPAFATMNEAHALITSCRVIQIVSYTGKMSSQNLDGIVSVNEAARACKIRDYSQPNLLRAAMYHISESANMDKIISKEGLTQLVNSLDIIIINQGQNRL